MRLLYIALLAALAHANTASAQSPSCLLSLNVDGDRGIEISSGSAPYSSTCGIVESRRQEIYEQIQELQGKSYTELKTEIGALRTRLDELRGQRAYKAIRAVGSKIIAYSAFAICRGGRVQCGLSLVGHVWASLDVIDNTRDIQTINTAINSLQSKLSEAENDLDAAQIQSVNTKEFLLESFENLCQKVKDQCL